MSIETESKTFLLPTTIPSQRLVLCERDSALEGEEQHLFSKTATVLL